MTNKLWDKGFEPDRAIEAYTVGRDRELDLRLARYDVEGSLAHIAMLEKIGLLTRDELTTLTAGLQAIAGEIAAGRFEIEPDTEDIHSQVELLLTRRLGDVGKKIHSGRSFPRTCSNAVFTTPGPLTPTLIIASCSVTP